ncbi:hypothetical protein AVEN_14677-1, partial [Araneus ventricosus]
MEEEGLSLSHVEKSEQVGIASIGDSDARSLSY